MEKFQIDPSEEKRRHEEALKKIDPRTAEILRKHLTYPPPQEEEWLVEEHPKETPRHKGPGAFIENSLPEGDR